MTSVSSSGADLLASIQQNLFKKIDTNGDGSVSKQEFVLARPKNVSESQATALYNKIDTGGSDALTQDQLAAGMKANRPQKSASDPSTNPLSDSLVSLIQQLLQSLGQDDQKNGSSASSAIAGIGQAPSASDIFSKIDTNGDGSVTQAEFVAARPAGISEDQANATFKSIDTAGTGSINEQQFADHFNAGAANQTAAGGTLPGGHHHHHHNVAQADDSDSSSSTTNSLLSALSDSSTSDSSGTSSEDDMLSTILKAIKSYGSGAASASTAGLTSTLLDI